MLDTMDFGDSLDEFLEDFPSVTREQAASTPRLPEQMMELLARLAGE